MIGEWKDFLVQPNGERKLIDEGRNLVVDTVSVALASAMKNDPNVGGFLYWAIGDGNTDDSAKWDDDIASGILTPEKSDTGLAREIFRKKIDPADIHFVDADDRVVETPTNRLRIRILLEEDEPSATETVRLREWGIFGGNATEEPGSGFLINRKLHRTFEKTRFFQLERFLWFTF